jgi:hypothetical protein
MRQLLLAPSLILVALATLTACAGEVSAPRQSTLVAERTTDYASLLENLRGAGLRVEPGQPAEQPFLSVEGRMLNVGDEGVQVFQYPHAAAADAQAALVSPDGRTVGTSKPHWIGEPHFYKRGRLLVLYVGDDDNVLKALDAVLGRQFAGK